MYNAIKSILKTKKLFVIAIIQLAVGISFLNYTNVIVIEAENKNNTIKPLFTEGDDYFVWLDPAVISDEEHDGYYGDKVYRIIDKLEELQERGIVEEAGSYYTEILYNPEIRDALFGSEKEYIKEYGGIPYYSPIVQIGEVMFKRLKNLEVVEGREPVLADFHKDYKTENIPIWLGREHRGRVEVGEVIESAGVQKETETERPIVGINFEVAGFLDKNELPIVYEEVLLGGNKVRLQFNNKMILIPEVEDFMSLNKGWAIDKAYGLVVRLTDDMYLPQFKKEIEAMGKKYKQLVLIESTKDVVAATIGNIENELEQNIVLGVVLTFLSVIGILSAMLGNVTRRYDEFGIKMSQGASIKDIIKEIFFEILLVVGCSVLLGNFLLLYRKLEMEYTLGIALQNVGLALGIAVVILIPIIFKIKKLSIVDLVRGK